MTTEFDPTTNRVPLGLLTDEEKKILMNWPHGVEFFHRDGVWRDVVPGWFLSDVYRGKPGPVVSSKRINVYADGVLRDAQWSRDEADPYLSNSRSRIAVLRIDTCNGVSTAHLEEV
jgi:hypothetical protein